KIAWAGRVARHAPLRLRLAANRFAQLRFASWIFALARFHVLPVHVRYREVERALQLVHGLLRAGRVAVDKRVRWNIAGDDAAGADHRAFADDHVREDRHVHADPATFLQRRAFHAEGADRVGVVGGTDAGSEEDVVFD